MTRGIALAMPASWSSIDLDPDTGEESGRRIVEEAIPSGPGAAEARGLMLGLLRRATEEARERKAVLAALYSSAADGIPLGASLVASVLEATARPDGQPRPDGPALADSLRATVAGGDGERRDLPGGPGSGSGDTRKPAPLTLSWRWRRCSGLCSTRAAPGSPS